MRRAITLALGLILGTVAIGCSSNDSGNGTTSGGGQASTTSEGSGGSGGSGGTSATGGGGSGGSGGHGGNTGGGGAAPGCKSMLCDDFESGMLDASIWTLDVGYDPTNLVTVQSDKVHGGKNAAHAHVAAAGGGFAILREAKTFPTTAESVWGRAYLYISIPPQAGHTGFISAYVQANDARVLEIGESGGNFQLTEYDHPGAEEPVGYPQMIPLEKWACFEWHFDRSTAPLIEVFIDGMPSVTYDTTHMPLDAMVSMGIGVDNHSTMPSDSDVYIDDVAIDTKRVGCLK